MQDLTRVLQAHAEAFVSLQRDMHALQAKLHILASQRTPYVLAVNTAPPEQKALMQQALSDFDRQIAATVNEQKREMRAALQRLIAHTTELMKLFE